MYTKGKIYKLQLKKGIVYTAKIEEEDHIQIKIRTVRGEELIINKDDLSQSKPIEQNRTDDKHARKR